MKKPATFFAFINMVILVCSINGYAQYMPYPYSGDYNLYNYSYGWNQPYNYGWNQPYGGYGWNQPYGGYGWNQPYGGYGWNRPYSSSYNSYSFNMPYNNSGFFPPYGDWYSVAPGYAAPTPANPLYKEWQGLQDPSPEFQEYLRDQFEKYGYNVW